MPHLSVVVFTITGALLSDWNLMPAVLSEDVSLFVIALSIVYGRVSDVVLFVVNVVPAASTTLKYKVVVPSEPEDTFHVALERGIVVHPVAGSPVAEAVGATPDLVV